jgi:hypothetical protein
MAHCAICYDDITDEKSCVKTPCGHCFDNECLTQWLLKKDTCPICRFKFGETKVDYDEDEEDDEDEPYTVDIFSNLLNCNFSNKNLSYNIKNTIDDIIDDLDESLEENNNEEDNIWTEYGDIKFTEFEIKTKQQTVNIYVEFIDEYKLIRIEMLNKTFNAVNKKIRNKNTKTQNWRFKKHNQRQVSRKNKKYRFN